jgi:hypothetical protein
MNHQAERRRRNRMAVHWPLRVAARDNGHSVDGVTEDLSSSGFCFISPGPFRPGELVEWVLAVPAQGTGRADLMLRGSAQVVRVREVSPAGVFGVGCLIQDYSVIPLPAVLPGLAETVTACRV